MQTQSSVWVRPAHTRTYAHTHTCTHTHTHTHTHTNTHTHTHTHTHTNSDVSVLRELFKSTTAFRGDTTRRTLASGTLVSHFSSFNEYRVLGAYKRNVRRGARVAYNSFFLSSSRMLCYMRKLIIDIAHTIDARVIRRPVATGNWGCGVFGGDPQLKFLIQWIACTVNGRAMRCVLVTHSQRGVSVTFTRATLTVLKR